MSAHVRLSLFVMYVLILQSTLALEGSSKGSKYRSDDPGRWAAPRGDSMNAHDASNGGSEVALGLLASRAEAIVRASDKQLKDPKDHLVKTKSVSHDSPGPCLLCLLILPPPPSPTKPPTGCSWDAQVLGSCFTRRIRGST